MSTVLCREIIGLSKKKRKKKKTGNHNQSKLVIEPENCRPPHIYKLTPPKLIHLFSSSSSSSVEELDLLALSLAAVATRDLLFLSI